MLQKIVLCALFATLAVGVEALVTKIHGRDVTIPPEMIAQVPLVRAAEAIQAALPPFASNGSVLSSGFAGFIMTSNSVELWWKGGRPDPAVSAVIDSIKDVKIEVRDAKFSLAELTRASAPLKAFIKEANAFHAVSIPSDGSSIVVHGDSSRAPSAGRGMDPESTLSSVLPDKLKQVSGLDVPIVVKAEKAPTAAQRYNDGAPIEGGIAICRGGWRCTAGFIVRNGGTFYILTAYHCGQGTWFTCSDRNNNLGIQIGPSASWLLQQDSMLIRASISVNGAVWDGPASGGEFLRGVQAFHTVLAQGMQYCQSGTTSGTICGIVVDRANVAVCYKEGAVPSFCMENMASGQRPDRATVICGGDSGGPLFSLDGNGKIYGLGLNSGMPSNGDNPCNNYMYFSPVKDVGSIYGVTPVQG
ncbi:hypothetical protein BJ742DRAFT_855554 [Cladochytrium replicatum]|nr:hypothetical protein BJ742DRAFT_855554 [Cladochytrium replicatum]